MLKLECFKLKFLNGFSTRNFQIFQFSMFTFQDFPTLTSFFTRFFSYFTSGVQKTIAPKEVTIPLIVEHAKESGKKTFIPPIRSCVFTFWLCLVGFQFLTIYSTKHPLIHFFILIFILIFLNHQPTLLAQSIFRRILNHLASYHAPVQNTPILQCCLHCVRHAMTSRLVVKSLLKRLMVRVVVTWN